MTVPLSHPLIAKQKEPTHLTNDFGKNLPEHSRNLDDHGCHDRWEDEGGALSAAGCERVEENAKAQPAKQKPITWLQYASKKAPQTRALPDWKLVLASVRSGSVLGKFSARNRSIA